MKDNKDFEIESVEEMLKQFDELSKKVKSIKGVYDTENVLEILEDKKINKFSNTGAHIIVPKKFENHKAKVIISKETFEPSNRQNNKKKQEENKS